MTVPQKTTTTCSPTASTVTAITPATPATTTTNNPRIMTTRTSSTTSGATQQTALWWERSVIQRSAYVIEAIVESMTEDSPFLQRAQEEEQQQQEEDQSIVITNNNNNPSPSPPVLFLNRSNVLVGRLLGKGSFSVVLEVTALTVEEEDKEEESAIVGGGRRLRLLRKLAEFAHQGRYAIKHLRPDLLQKKDPEYFQGAAADLIQDAKFLATLNHPHILKVHAVAKGGAAAYCTSGGAYDGFFILTDRLDGTLKDKILEWQCLEQEESLAECFRFSGGGGGQPQEAAQERQEEEDGRNGSNSGQAMMNGAMTAQRILLEKVNIAHQLAKALRYLHENRLIYRDLKPQNVGLIDNQVKLFDFGFCRELPTSSWSYPSSPSLDNDEDDDDALYYMSGKGSLMYLAPEVLRNGKYNQKADVYSFAMVFYELLTLNKPFHAVPNQDVFRELICHHKARPPLEFSSVPASLQDLLRHAWDDNVYGRWTMRKICDQLESIISNELMRMKMPVMKMEQQSSLLSLQEEEPQHQGRRYTSCKSLQVSHHDLSRDAGAGGAVVLDMVFGFARDLHRGYKILTAPIDNGFQSKPMEASVPKCLDDSFLCADSVPVLSGNSTTETVDSSSVASFGAAASASSIPPIPAIATEDPVEVTLEQAFSMSVVEDDEDEDEGADVYNRHGVDDDVYNNRDDDVYNRDDDNVGDDRERDCRSEEDPLAKSDTELEVRCPPSPLARTISAPIAQPISRRQSTGTNNNNGVVNGISPREQTTPRRQSYSGKEISFPESHFLPTAIQLHG